MELLKLQSLITRAGDGCQAAGDRGEHDMSQQMLAGMWWTLNVVSSAMQDNPIAIKALQEIGHGNVDLKGMREYIRRDS